MSLPTTLVRSARQAEPNLSEPFERTTVPAVPNTDRQQWLDANRDAIENYNEHVVQHGVFSDGLRRF